MRASAVATLFSLAAGASAFTVGGPAIVSRPVSFCVDGSRFLVSSCPRSKIIIQTLTRAISMRISLVLGGGNAMVLPKQIPPGLAHEDVAVQSYEQSGCAVFISFMLTINLLSIILFHARFFFEQIAHSSTAQNVLLSQEETDTIIAKADACIDSECAIDEVDNLVKELKEQEIILNNRLVDVMNMVAHLQKVNTHGRDRNEVREFVKDLLRVFSHEDTKHYAAGFSGDIGKGPTTAFDVLDPPKYKP